LVRTKNADSGWYLTESPQFTNFQSFQLNVDWLIIENELSAGSAMVLCGIIGMFGNILLYVANEKN